MSDIDEEFEQLLAEIEEQKANLTEDEQNTIDAWVSKLKGLEDEDDKPTRNEYANYLRGQLTRDDRHLSVPYLQNPPGSTLPRLQELLNQLRSTEPGPSTKEHRRYFCSVNDAKQPCRSKTVFPKILPPERSYEENKNEFEDANEMAKAIARSKGLTLAQFVADISRHTSDKGQELRKAMKAETSEFSEYVQRILEQRVKDLAGLLDDKQNFELLRFQKDYDKWQSELSNCKKRIKEIIPNFDLDSYRRDKNYFKKIFTVGTCSQPGEDKFKEWKDENCHRLVWFVSEIRKLTEENNQVIKEISDIKLQTLELEQKESKKQRCHANYMQTERGKYNQLKQRSDKLGREITELLMSLEN